jgi:hypothetical protein
MVAGAVRAVGVTAEYRRAPKKSNAVEPPILLNLRQRCDFGVVGEAEKGSPANHFELAGDVAGAKIGRRADTRP